MPRMWAADAARACVGPGGGGGGGAPVRRHRRARAQVDDGEIVHSANPPPIACGGHRCDLRQTAAAAALAVASCALARAPILPGGPPPTRKHRFSRWHASRSIERADEEEAMRFAAILALLLVALSVGCGGPAPTCGQDPCCGDPCCGDPCCGDPCCGDPCCGDPCCGDPCCGDPSCLRAPAKSSAAAATDAPVAARPTTDSPTK